MKKVLYTLFSALLVVSVYAADIGDWSTTAASNNSASPNGFPENMAPSGLNDSAREMMAVLARWYEDANCSNDSAGSANAYTLAASQTISAYAQGQVFCFESTFANTGAATLNVDSVGAKTIKKKRDQDLASGDIEDNQLVVVAYNATDDVFELLSSVANGDLSNVVEDTTPQLGGNLDANTFNILMDGNSYIADESGNEVIYISSESSAVNELGIQNASTGNDVVIFASGDDTNIDIDIQTKGSGVLRYNGTEVSTGSSFPAPDFTSSEQTVSVDTVLDVAHGLGAIPSFFRVILRCKTSDLGYSVGDEVVWIGGSSSNAADRGAQVFQDATNITIVQASAIPLVEYSSLNVGGITTSSWRWVVEAWQ